MRRRSFVLAGTASAVLTACGGGGGSSGSGGVGTVPEAQNRFTQANLVASNSSYGAKYVLPDFLDAWGIAIRPAGAGGHFWIGGGGASWEFIGDVRNSPTASLRELTTDGLQRVSVTGTQNPVAGGTVTGVAFNGAAITSTIFEPVFTDTRTMPPTVLRQTMPDGAGGTVTIHGSARFIFVTDNGYIAAWSERRQDNGQILRNDGGTQRVFDGTVMGSAFFGAAVKPDTFDTLWVADFGASPQIRQFDAAWNLVPTVGFVNPFGTGAGGAVKPGDFVPFNIQTLGHRVLVTYAKSRLGPSDITTFYAGEEDAVDADAERLGGYQPDRGRLVEFTTAGQQVRIYQDAKHLNAPWGVALAPDSFGAFAGAVLVGNFGGAGLISGFSSSTGEFLGYLRTPSGAFVAITGLWGLQFGNGASLGDSDALYFAAGPEDEKAGLFGSLRYSPG